MSELTKALIKSHEQAIRVAKNTLNLLYESDKITGNNSKDTADGLLRQIKMHRDEIKTLQAGEQT
jgi:hypothetical protein